MTQMSGKAFTNEKQPTEMHPAAGSLTHSTTWNKELKNIYPYVFTTWANVQDFYTSPSISPFQVSIWKQYREIHSLDWRRSIAVGMEPFSHNASKAFEDSSSHMCIPSLVTVVRAWRVTTATITTYRSGAFNREDETMPSQISVKTLVNPHFEGLLFLFFFKEC